MWKMRVWKESVGVWMGDDEGCPPRAHRSWPDWKKYQRRGPLICLPACSLSIQHSHNAVLHPLFLTPPSEGQPVAPPADPRLLSHYGKIKRMNDILTNLFSRFIIPCVHYAKTNQQVTIQSPASAMIYKGIDNSQCSKLFLNCWVTAWSRGVAHKC